MSKHLNIEIETSDRQLAFEMFETKSLVADESHLSLPDGSTVEYAGSLVRKSVGLPEVVSVVITLAGGVGTGVAGQLALRQAEMQACETPHQPQGSRDHAGAHPNRHRGNRKRQMMNAIARLTPLLRPSAEPI